MLSLQTRDGDILRVEGVTVSGLVQPVDALLPPGGVHLAGQVVLRIVMAEQKKCILSVSIYILYTRMVW